LGNTVKADSDPDTDSERKTMRWLVKLLWLDAHIALLYMTSAVIGWV